MEQAEGMKPSAPPALVWTAPLRLVSLTNQREHWRVRHKRNQEHKRVAVLLTALALRDHPMGPPYTVTIIRISKGELDSDNLQSACKTIRDSVAEALGIDDGDKAAAIWLYEQEKGEYYAVRVKIVGERSKSEIVGVPRYGDKERGRNAPQKKNEAAKKRH